MKLIAIGANNPETIRMISAVKEKDSAFEFLGFIDNDPEKKGKSFFGFPVFGGSECIPSLLGEDIFFINLITRDCVTRFETSLQASDYGARFANFIHPSVNLEMVELAEGNYIQERVILQAGVKIGCNSSIHIGTLVGHESIIGNSVFLAHGCNISGGVTIKDGVLMGTGVSVIPRVTIGEWAVIGAGTVVHKDIPPYSLVVGNPARVLRQKEVPYVSGKAF
ncbi:MAG: transferase [Candidatus Omnitrophota bacterium]